MGEWTSKKDIKKLIDLIKGKFDVFDKSKLSVSGGGIGNNTAVPLEIINNGNDETAIGFRNKGVNLGNINFNVNRFQIFSNNLGGIKSKQILIISNSARTIYDYKSGTLKEILVDGDVSHFQPGEVFSISSDVPLAGFLTTSATEIFFTIPLPKDATGRTVNVACTNLRVRGNAGYLVENKDISEYKIRTTIFTNLLSIRISQASGEKFYDTNNIAVTVAGVFTITFS